MASLYKINQILKEKQYLVTNTIKSEEELLTQMLLKVYTKFKDVFLKTALEELLSYCLYNYKIKIEKENTIRYNPLCH